MRILTIAILITSIAAAGSNAQTLAKKWATEPLFETPESVVYDDENHILFVSNISGRPDEKNGMGFISRLSMKGEIKKLKWITGLNAPKGMGIFRGKLFVSDIDELVVIDIAKSAVVQRYKVAGSIFLNDIAVDKGGNVYISDSMRDQDAIYRFDGQNAVLWLQGRKILRPNGLCFDNGNLIVGVSGDGMLRQVDMKTKEISDRVATGSNIDGVAVDGKGNFIASDWKGRTVFIEPDGVTTVLLDTSAEKINAADICFLSKWNMLLIPTFYDNRVVACTLKY
ncbi:MAG: SMP-30/gluconolactonase/LRE family protein [Candidatus Krumholzibacteriota bacterium]|nr:SMP-30/gluconolactonase/LRE family protein [Candidatus Krumholzibacteriota bacterium]